MELTPADPHGATVLHNRFLLHLHSKAGFLPKVTQHMTMLKAQVWIRQKSPYLFHCSSQVLFCFLIAICRHGKCSAGNLGSPYQKIARMLLLRNPVHFYQKMKAQDSHPCSSPGLDFLQTFCIVHAKGEHLVHHSATPKEIVGGSLPSYPRMRVAS